MVPPTYVDINKEENLLQAALGAAGSLRNDRDGA